MAETSTGPGAEGPGAEGRDPPAAPGWAPIQPPAQPAAQPAAQPTTEDQPAAAAAGWTGQPGWGGQPAQWRPAIKPGVIPLRPLGVGEILDGAISAIRQHPRVMLGIAAVVGVVSALLSGLTNWLALGGAESLDLETATDEEVTDFFIVFIAALGATGLLTFLATVVATGLLTVAVSRAVLGQEVSLRAAWLAARPYLLRLIGLAVLTTLIVIAVWAGAAALAFLLAATGTGGAAVAIGVVGFIGGFVAAAYFYVRLALAPPALVLEKQRIIPAIRRSSRLVKGSWWRTLGILVLAWLLATILGQIIQTPFGLLGFGTGYFAPTDEITAPGLIDLTLAGLGVIVASAITLPFQAGVTALLYIDQRMRREGLDIELARTAAPPEGEHAP